MKGPRRLHSRSFRRTLVRKVVPVVPVTGVSGWRRPSLYQVSLPRRNRRFAPPVSLSEINRRDFVRWRVFFRSSWGRRTCGLDRSSRQEETPSRNPRGTSSASRCPEHNPSRSDRKWRMPLSPQSPSLLVVGVGAGRYWRFLQRFIRFTLLSVPPRPARTQQMPAKVRLTSSETPMSTSTGTNLTIYDGDQYFRARYFHYPCPTVAPTSFDLLKTRGFSNIVSVTYMDTSGTMARNISDNGTSTVNKWYSKDFSSYEGSGDPRPCVINELLS